MVSSHHKMSMGQNRFGIPFWGRCTTHFRLYFSGWIESDVHWGYDLDFDPWPSSKSLVLAREAKA